MFTEWNTRILLFFLFVKEVLFGRLTARSIIELRLPLATCCDLKRSRANVGARCNEADVVEFSVEVGSIMYEHTRNVRECVGR